MNNDPNPQGKGLVPVLGEAMSMQLSGIRELTYSEAKGMLGLHASG